MKMNHLLKYYTTDVTLHVEMRVSRRETPLEVDWFTPRERVKKWACHHLFIYVIHCYKRQNVDARAHTDHSHTD